MLAACGVDYLGFPLGLDVDRGEIGLATAAPIVAALPAGIEPVLITYRVEPDAILELASGSLDVSQAKNMTVFTVELPVPRARRKLRLDTTSDSRVDMKIPASST